jgi:hypothetical protein
MSLAPGRTGHQSVSVGYKGTQELQLKPDNSIGRREILQLPDQLFGLAWDRYRECRCAPFEVPLLVQVAGLLQRGSEAVAVP